MKLFYKGEVVATFTSVPAGVTFQVKPGNEVEVDGGFDYLRDDPRFDVLDESGTLASASDEPKPAKTKK